MRKIVGRVFWTLFALVMIGTLLDTTASFSSGSLRSMFHRAGFPDDGTGTVTSSGATGDWTMHVNACVSGQRQSYWGVAFFDDDQRNLGGHLALPESGPEHVVVNLSNGQDSLQFDQNQCTVWDVGLNHTNTSYNRIVGIAGHARFDCRNAEPAARVVGALQFRSCH